MIGDFNNDSRRDIIIVRRGAYGAAQNSLLLTNLGNTTFSVSLLQLASGDLSDVATADFNNDGKLDLLLPTATGLQVLPGNGNGTFGTGTSYSGQCSRVAIADFNNDSAKDFVALCNVSGTLKASILLNNGTGTFTVSTIVAARPSGLA